jgi:Domain of unknown function (DUF4111)/Nucleotidyltransferase domain
MSDIVDPETTRYLEDVVARLRAILGDELVGAYAGGSLALGGYDPGRSDIDIAVVCRGKLADETKLEIVSALRHEALPCPARGLELVVYPESNVCEATPAAGYELNLNTGRSMPFHLSLSPGDGEAEHWYGIDRAIVRDHGRVLFGPPPQPLFGTIPKRMLLDLLIESLRWHENAGVARGDDAVLNACRALRYAAEGVWSSKIEAGRWARGRVDDGALVSDALAARTDGRRLDPRRVAAFLETARRSLEAAADARTGPSHS